MSADVNAGRSQLAGGRGGGGWSVPARGRTSGAARRLLYGRRVLTPAAASDATGPDRSGRHRYPLRSTAEWIFPERKLSAVANDPKAVQFRDI